MKRFAVLVFSVLVFSGCASGPPELPYPAFVQVDELPNVFIASLPGVRAKQLAGDAMTRRTSNRVDLPADWTGTSGGTPGRSVEIFVLRGQIDVADINLGSGGYLYLPSGSLGFNLTTRQGAQILYFVYDDEPNAVIQSPIIIDSQAIDWEDGDSLGVQFKELRYDPGTGSRTWITRVKTGANLPWTSSTVTREAYLVSGNQQYSECINGEIETWSYTPGGYVLRPADVIHGGPEAVAYTDATWFMREAEPGISTTWPACEAAAD